MPKRTAHIELPWGDSFYSLTVEVTPGCPPVYYPNDKAHPGEDPELEIVHAEGDGPLDEETLFAIQESDALYDAVMEALSAEDRG